MRCVRPRQRANSRYVRSLFRKPYHRKLFHLSSPYEGQVALLPLCTLWTAADPAPGLSHTCLMCLHATHLRCWKVRKDNNCATGCGCRCASASEEYTAPSRVVSASRTSSRFASYTFDDL